MPRSAATSHDRAVQPARLRELDTGGNKLRNSRPPQTLMPRQPPLPREAPEPTRRFALQSHPRFAQLPIHRAAERRQNTENSVAETQGCIEAAGIGPVASPVITTCGSASLPAHTSVGIGTDGHTIGPLRWIWAEMGIVSHRARCGPDALMFETLTGRSRDKSFPLMQLYKNDPRDRQDRPWLGVYKEPHGADAPSWAAFKSAEHQLWKPRTARP